MNKNNNAFTLAEVLIVMAIVGVITTIGLSTYKKQADNIYYTYSKLYHSLDQAVYNTMNYTNDGNPFKKIDGTEATGSEATTRLCNALTNYISGAGEASCNAPSFDLTAANPFETVQPHFVAANGMRFWISQRYPIVETDSNTNEEHHDHDYILVFVDINGQQKKPNSMEYIQGEKMPDVFAFAVLDIGRVCPLGPPEIDEKIMRTRILFKLEQEQASEANVRFSEPSKPYFVTKAEAWGYYGVADVPNNFYMDDNPYTYNDIIRTNLPGNWASIIYGGDWDLSAALTEYANANGTVSLGSRQENINGEQKTFQCEKEYDDVCDLIIDKYRF